LISFLLPFYVNCPGIMFMKGAYCCSQEAIVFMSRKTAD